MIKANDSVRLVDQFVDELNLGELYKTYLHSTRENQVTPRQMLKIVLYAHMCNLYSSRQIESACRRDINFMWLLGGRPAPDHATIARFISIHFSVCAKEIMSEFSNLLFELGEISGHDIFIDGTKIESVANKYTFVWKRSVTKRMAKLGESLSAFVQSCEELYGIKVAYTNEVKIYHLKKLRKKLYAIKAAEGVTFVHGSGKRKTGLQRSIETLESYLDKIKEYTRHLHNIGERNSYSKTDPDATFMRMKEDYMRNGQLKPGYNLQHGVDSEYITWVTVSWHPTDTRTLIPFLTEMHHFLGFRYTNIVADSGYESEENYEYLKANGLVPFIKPANYEISKTRKYRTDISRMENMTYDEDRDVYICRNEKELKVSYENHPKTAAGYQRTTTVYECHNCDGCPYKTACIKGNNCKTSIEERHKKISVSKRLKALRQEDLQNILSDEGIRLRVNRSIQAEGSFAQLKADMGFRRFLYRGQDNVFAESVMMALSQNLNRLHQKVQNGRTGHHLFEIPQSA